MGGGGLINLNIRDDSDVHDGGDKASSCSLLIEQLIRGRQRADSCTYSI